MKTKVDIAGFAVSSSFPFGFLGALKQVCLVTHDLDRSIKGMLKVGVGPWKVYPFNRTTCTNLTYRGEPTDLSFKIALADTPGLQWEIIQPVEGPNIYSDFLSSHGEGLHHLLFDCNSRDWKEKTAAFDAAGYSCIQSGRWGDCVTFAYYGTDAETGVILEICDVPPTWRRPDPEAVYS